jgi:hypothetical protein
VVGACRDIETVLVIVNMIVNMMVNVMVNVPTVKIDDMARRACLEVRLKS